MATILSFMRFPAAILALAAGGASAQTTIGDMTMVTVEGACGDLAVAGRDLGGQCGPKLLNVTYGDGRVGFYFVLANGALIAFSGMDDENPDADSDVVRLDKVIMSRADKPDAPDVFPAAGTCAFGNPYKGPARIECKGKFKDGRPFSATFTTNGKPPG